MDAKADFSLVSSDFDRARRFLELLPEDKFRYFLDELSSGAYDDRISRNLDNYIEYLRSPFSRFSDNKIQVASEEFNKTFREFYSFLLTHFFYIQPNFPRIALYPEMRHAGGEQEKLWDQKFAELMGIKHSISVKYDQLLETFRDIDDKADKMSLKGAKIEFDDDGHAILINGVKCELPPYKNEHDLCRVMFKEGVGHAVDWSDIHKQISGEEEIGDKKDMRRVQDTAYAINSRIKKQLNTDDDLFSWSNKTLSRNI